MSRQVRRKCPMWLVAKVSSMPSSLRVRSGMRATPALLMMISMVGTSAQERTLAAPARTEAWLERSIWRSR
jgi:hypothetical protein